MPIIKASDAKVDAQQLSFVDSVRRGRVVPILSNEGVFNLLLNGHQHFGAQYADYINYPLPDRDNLAKIAKFYKLEKEWDDKTLKWDYLNFVKNYIYTLAKDAGVAKARLDEAEDQMDELPVSAFAARLGYPHFDRNPADRLLVLADLPLQTILTTSPYTFIEAALRVAKKEPYTAYCHWNQGASAAGTAIADDYEPSVHAPLVYHLHGLDSDPNSLVLTEDDYLTFLVNICQDRSRDATDRLPALVRGALAGDLIMLGFSLNSWAFRVLYAGLIKLNNQLENRGICCLQVTPSKAEEKFLRDYLKREAKFNVFWGELHEYADELRK